MDFFSYNIYYKYFWILSSNSPKEAKSFGRRVKNFNEDLWDKKI